MAQRFPFSAKYLLSNWARYLWSGDAVGPKGYGNVIASLMASVPRDPDDEDDERAAPVIRPPINIEAARIVDSEIRGMSLTDNRVAKWKWVRSWDRYEEVFADTKIPHHEFVSRARKIEEIIQSKLCSI